MVMHWLVGNKAATTHLHSVQKTHIKEDVSKLSSLQSLTNCVEIFHEFPGELYVLFTHSFIGSGRTEPVLFCWD
jgi:hypothetical protein